MSLWTSEDAAQVTGGEARGTWAVDGISIDTRSIAQGDLFVALKAARDGHDFVAQALDKGASAALVTRVPEGVAEDAPLLIVRDVQRALEALGQAARARSKARVVAVTGSVGKTSTKEMLACMLADQGRTHAAVASYNNHWGVPLTLARMPQDTEFAVIEVGMNHPGEIAPLARQARPHVALVTTVAAVHLEAFADVAAIAREKAAIMEGLEPNGRAILNADIDETPVLAAEAAARGVPVSWFGATTEGYETKGYHLGDITLQGEETRAEVICNGVAHRLSIQSLGAHFAMNALGALAAVDALGGEISKAVQSLARWSPVQGRGARFEVALTGGVLTVIDDSFNANPTSVGAALAVLAAETPGEGGRRIACLADMGELGTSEHALHAGLADLASVAEIDLFFCVGPLMRSLYDALPEARRGGWFETSAEAVAPVRAMVQRGDIALIKGSKYMKMPRLVDALREMGEGSGSV